MSSLEGPINYDFTSKIVVKSDELLSKQQRIFMDIS
jgi:hypothetical protein